MKKPYSIDHFSAGHFFEELSFDETFYCKKFFGGLAIYVFGRMVAYLCEGPGSDVWRGKKFGYEIWNGCLIPTFREHHSDLLNKLEGTLVHPVLEKWIYLPQNSSHFEESMIRLVELIERKSLLVGIEPSLKSKKKTKKKGARKKQVGKITNRIKVSQMMNLGPAVEKDFAAVGIHYADEIIKLGPKKSFLKMLDGRLKIGRSAECCNALYLYSLYGAIKEIHWAQIPDEKKIEFKEFTAKLRKSGKYDNKTRINDSKGKAKPAQKKS